MIGCPHWCRHRDAAEHPRTILEAWNHEHVDVIHETLPIGRTETTLGPMWAKVEVFERFDFDGVRVQGPCVVFGGLCGPLGAYTVDDLARLEQLVHEARETLLLVDAVAG